MIKKFLVFAWALLMVPIPTASAQSAPTSATEHAEITVDPKILDGYAGTYQLAPNFVITVTRDGDHLYTQALGQDRVELFAESGTKFFEKIGQVQISFKTDEHGEATEFVVLQGAQEITCKRLGPKTLASLSPHFAEIDSMAASDLAKRPVGSVTIGVVSGKQLIWTKSYGDADMESHTLADHDTVYRIGSITKMFTALMLEQLVDAGKVHFSDPAEKYFPEIQTVQDRFAGASPVTLFQLSTHTAGLGNEPDDLDTYVKGPVATWEKTLIAALPRTHYQFEPGTRSSYSNIGFAILGASLARAAGEPYVEYVSKHIFEPLGMTHSAFEPNPEMLPHLSKGYQVGPDGIDSKTPEREHAGRGYKVPNGAIYTTVDDLARFASFLMGDGPEGVLKVASLERFLTQSAVQADFNLSTGSGPGFMVTRRDNYSAFGHFGIVAGYTAALEINRPAGVAVIVLANGPANTVSLALRSLDALSK